MIISFDIDNTLIPYNNEFEVENPSNLFKLIGAEPLRKDAKELFLFLEAQQHQIWIYTTSFRSIFHLKKTFWAHGLKPKRFINENINQKILRKHFCNASKNPVLFGIDLHIDDSIGVEKEGEIYGFDTLIIQPNDAKWVDKIKSRIYKC